MAGAVVGDAGEGCAPFDLARSGICQRHRTADVYSSLRIAAARGAIDRSGHVGIGPHEQRGNIQRRRERSHIGAAGSGLAIFLDPYWLPGGSTTILPFMREWSVQW